MPKNIEIKARLTDRSGVRSTLKFLGATGPIILRQRDTFYYSPRGRLKLRECAGRSAELILYFRSDARRARSSEYVSLPVADVKQTRRLLKTSHGELGLVLKTRHLYLMNDVRIHLDDVRHLGHFLEIEVLMHNRTTAAGLKIAKQLMADLDLQKADLVAAAYFDLLNQKR